MKYDSKPCKLLSARQLTGDVFDFVLEAPALAAMAQPGQFAQILVPGHTLRRPISICGIDKTAGTLRFVFQIRGQGTAELAQFQPGSTIEILAPLGNGFPVDKSKRTLLVGGGIGVPPLLGQAAYTWGRSVAVLGFRCAERAMLVEDFREKCTQVVLCSDDGSLGHHGFVDEQVRRILAKDQTVASVLACGPKPMLRAVAAAAAEYGVRCQVSLEERMACGIGACLGCAIRMADGTMKHVCKDGPVFEAEEVDWNV